MKKFNVYAGLEQEHYNLQVINDLYFDSVVEAIQYAREFAEGLYQMNPVRDTLEIMKEDKIDEDVAYLTFKLEMFRKTLYYVEEIVEINGEVIEVIKHQRG